MLNKFQEQDLFASVEKLEDIKKLIDNSFDCEHDIMANNLIVINNEIDKIISIIKNIKPLLFSYPQVAKYTTEEFDSTIVEKDNADT